MPDSAQLAALREVAGDGAVSEHAPVEIDGCTLGVTIEPTDPDALAATLAKLGTLGLSALPRGGGDLATLGNPPLSGDVVLSTGGLVGVDVFDANEGVCHVAAGTRLRDLRDVAREGGWELPLDPPGAAATVGGTIAAAALGPRALGFGLPRDVVLGLEISLATGERIRCGGRVVKNVTGYDLGKLFTGSLGTLGVIESGWLRLRPLPATTVLLSGGSGSGPEACELGLTAARLGSARAVAVTRQDAAPDRGWKVTVELAGDAPSVEIDRQVLAARADLSEDAAALAAVRALQNEVPKPGGARFRLALLATELPAAVTRLADDGASILAYPGLGLVYAGLALPERPDERAAEAAFRIVETAASDGRAAGPIRCESAPTWAKRGRDVFGESGGTLGITRELKRRYDPRSVLNPGRFAGRT